MARATSALQMCEQLTDPSAPLTETAPPSYRRLEGKSTDSGSRIAPAKPEHPQGARLQQGGVDTPKRFQDGPPGYNKLVHFSLMVRRGG
jgi:hypothetical protein